MARILWSVFLIEEIHSLSLCLALNSFCDETSNAWALLGLKTRYCGFWLGLSPSHVGYCCLVMSDSLQPHRLQHARLPCPSPSPRACSNSCPLSWWWVKLCSSLNILGIALLWNWFFFQHSCLKNPMNSMKRQKNLTLKDELPRSVGTQYTTREQQRNSSGRNEEAEPT